MRITDARGCYALRELADGGLRSSIRLSRLLDSRSGDLGGTEVLRGLAGLPEVELAAERFIGACAPDSSTAARLVRRAALERCCI